MMDLFSAFLIPDFTSVALITGCALGSITTRFVLTTSDEGNGEGWRLSSGERADVDDIDDTDDGDGVLRNASKFIEPPRKTLCITAALETGEGPFPVVTDGDGELSMLEAIDDTDPARLFLRACCC